VSTAYNSRIINADTALSSHKPHVASHIGLSHQTPTQYQFTLLACALKYFFIVFMYSRVSYPNESVIRTKKSYCKTCKPG